MFELEAAAAAAAAPQFLLNGHLLDGVTCHSYKPLSYAPAIRLCPASSTATLWLQLLRQLLLLLLLLSRA